MKALNTLIDRTLDKLVANRTAHAVELVCMNGCSGRSATYKYMNGRLWFDHCGC